MDIKANMQMIMQGSLFAVGSITVDNLFTIENVKAVTMEKDGEMDIFVSMPQMKSVNGFKNLVGTDGKTKAAVKAAVVEAIDRAVKEYSLPYDMPFEYIVTPVSNGKTLAKVTIIYDGEMDMTGFKLMKGDNGMYLSYPKEKVSYRDGHIYNNMYSFSSDMKRVFQIKVIEQYEKEKNKVADKNISR